MALATNITSIIQLRPSLSSPAVSVNLGHSSESGAGGQVSTKVGVFSPGSRSYRTDRTVLYRTRARLPLSSVSTRNGKLKTHPFLPIALAREVGLMQSPPSVSLSVRSSVSLKLLNRVTFDLDVLQAYG